MIATQMIMGVRRDRESERAAVRATVLQALGKSVGETLRKPPRPVAMGSIILEGL